MALLVVLLEVLSLNSKLFPVDALAYFFDTIQMSSNANQIFLKFPLVHRPNSPKYPRMIFVLDQGYTKSFLVVVHFHDVVFIHYLVVVFICLSTQDSDLLYVLFRQSPLVFQIGPRNCIVIRRDGKSNNRANFLPMTFLQPGISKRPEKRDVNAERLQFFGYAGGHTSGLGGTVFLEALLKLEHLGKHVLVILLYSLPVKVEQRTPRPTRVFGAEG